MDWYLVVLKNYANFEGRARRKEYWMFVLFNAMFGVVTMVIDNLLGMGTNQGGISPLNTLYSLAVFIPGLAVTIRRLHDIGKSGWMMFVALIPFVGFIWLFVLFVTEGTPGDNEYGESPKENEIMM